jgi:hypothetical protein
VDRCETRLKLGAALFRVFLDVMPDFVLTLQFVDAKEDEDDRVFRNVLHLSRSRLGSCIGACIESAAGFRRLVSSWKNRLRERFHQATTTSTLLPTSAALTVDSVVALLNARFCFSNSITDKEGALVLLLKDHPFFILLQTRENYLDYRTCNALRASVAVAIRRRIPGAMEALHDPPYTLTQNLCSKRTITV